MGELIQFIFSLEDAVGRNIVWIILVLFVFGSLNYLWHILMRLPWEWWNLRKARIYFEKKSGIGDISDLLKNLRIAKVWPRSIIYRRIADFVHIKQSGGDINNNTLADILIGQESRKASLANHTLGILIILGLIGTLWGLITALIEVRPLLTGIQDFEQLPEISATLKETVSSMSTAFATTLTGLGTSLLLGIIGWSFNRFQSAFLTRLETYVSTAIMPQFTQTPDTSIESAVQHLSASTDMLEFTTQENVRVIQQAIQQLTDTSWGGRLEQQYILANKFGATAESLLESLTGINEYQVIITTAVEKFENLTQQSMARIKKYQETLHQGLEDSVPKLQEEGEALKTAIQEYQKSQARFIDDLSSTLQTQLQSITQNQQNMVDALTQLAEVQNQVFEGVETQLVENQEEMLRAFTQLGDGLQIHFSSVLETQNEVFKGIETQLAENQQKTVDVLTQLANDSQTRFQSVVETQNKVFKGIETQLSKNQQETTNSLTQLANKLQLRPLLEAQNQVSERIETQLAKNQEEMLHAFAQLGDGLQVHFSSAVKTQNEIFTDIQTQLSKNQQETINIFTRLVDESQSRFQSALETQNEVFKDIETQLIASRREIIDALTQLTDEMQIQSVLEAQNQVFERIETQLISSQRRIFDSLTQLTDEMQIRSMFEAQNQVFGRIESHLMENRDLAAEQSRLIQTLITNVQQFSQASSPSGDSSNQVSSQLVNQISLKFDLLNQKLDTLNNTMRQPGIYRWFSEIRRWFGGSR